MREEIRKLTEQMVAIASVNGTRGEGELADFLLETLRQIPYFKAHPEYVFFVPLKEDPYGRKNVFALLKGERGTKPDTIVLHGHMDTVGVEDFGSLKSYAFDSGKLPELLASLPLADEVRNDLESGDYLFGRGSCDMKSGDAVFLWLLKYLSRQIQNLSGNLLVMFNPVEENMHTGMQEALGVLERLRRDERLEYRLAINNDYICPLYPGDPHRYLYTGAVGKLLPCFYIRGCETHVGQCYEGFSASLLAAELERQVDLNPAYCNAYDGETSLPPTVLKLQDLKDFYNVQTAKEAFVYFNYMVHGASVEEITAKMKEAAQLAAQETTRLQQERYRAFCDLTHLAFKPKIFDCRVLLYEELYKLAQEQFGEELEPMLTARLGVLKKKETDSRVLAMELVRYLADQVALQGPFVVLFYAPPYCPHNTLNPVNPKEKAIVETLHRLKGRFEELAGAPFEIMHFFPSLSDSSYLKLDDDAASVRTLVENFPAQNQLFPVPLEQIQALNIPAVNFGVYGKDAHKWTERVYMPYSFETLPKMLVAAVAEFFGDTLLQP